MRWHPVAPMGEVPIIIRGRQRLLIKLFSEYFCIVFPRASTEDDVYKGYYIPKGERISAPTLRIAILNNLDVYHVYRHYVDYQRMVSGLFMI